jgi:quercetin dioxygenase-like cupin family protein
MTEQAYAADAVVGIGGRRLALPPGPIFNLQRAADAVHELGAFRAWAGYKDLGAEGATDGLVRFQHVVSFGASEDGGRTGVHCHLAHVHLVIPTSGRGVFSYDGVITEAAPGAVIVQHGGTVHDQFEYSYAPAPPAENARTPLSLEPTPADAPPRSFGFLELFLPEKIADVEIVPPGEVTGADQASAWDHPYHAPGARFSVQGADGPGAAYRPVAGRPDLEARDAATWDASGRYVATWIVRPASGGAGDPVALAVPGETGGLDILFMVAGQAQFQRDGAPFAMAAGDCVVATAGLAAGPTSFSADLRLLRLFISSRAEGLRERTPAEIARLIALGPRIVTRRQVRPAGDRRPVNVLAGQREPKGEGESGAARQPGGG